MFAVNKIAKASPFLGYFKRFPSLFLPSTAFFQFEQAAGFKYRPKRTNKKGLNIHRSNKAKAGLYHGKDKQFGHSISHSHHRSKRSWLPNVQKKRLWSDALNQWIRFNTTTTAMKAVAEIGGIDQYLLNLDEKYVQDSPFITRYRDLVARASYLNGDLSPKHVHYFGFDKNPPSLVDISVGSPVYTKCRKKFFERLYSRKNQAYPVLLLENKWNSYFEKVTPILRIQSTEEEKQKEKEKEKVIRKNTFTNRRKAIIAKISKLRAGPPHNPLIEEAIRLKKEKRDQQAAAAS